ncbi:hypothetical protein [Yersinia thracica]|uniref:hypothetical protein n=1 Tax=Yersinia thracica TaxID=2890319 RepID=UPI0011A1BBF6|nr:hypothetical protein [Yersinia thracica]
MMGLLKSIRRLVDKDVRAMMIMLLRLITMPASIRSITAPPISPAIKPARSSFHLLSIATSV